MLLLYLNTFAGWTQHFHAEPQWQLTAHRKAYSFAQFKSVKQEALDVRAQW